MRDEIYAEVYAFVEESDVKTIRAPFFREGEEVVIRKFSYADRQVLSGDYLKVKADWGEDEEEPRVTEVEARVSKRGRKRGRKRRDKAKLQSEFLLGEMNLAILKKGIKSWILFNKAGQEVSLSRKNIDKLGDTYAEFILQEINDFNPTETEEDEEDEEEFFPGSEGGDEGGAELAV